MLGVLGFGVVLSGIFIIDNFQTVNIIHEMFGSLVEAMIWKSAGCTGGLVWENPEGAGDRFECSCTVS